MSRVMQPAEVEKWLLGLGSLVPREALNALLKEVKRLDMDGDSFAKLVAARTTPSLGDAVRPSHMATLRRCWTAGPNGCVSLSSAPTPSRNSSNTMLTGSVAGNIRDCVRADPVQASSSTVRPTSSKFAPPPRSAASPPPRSAVSKDLVPEVSMPTYVEEQRIAPECGTPEMSSPLSRAASASVVSMRPPSIPKLDLTTIHRNAGNKGGQLNSRQWQQPAMQQPAKPIGKTDSTGECRAEGFARASAEDQQRIAEFYGYRDEDFAAAMHGLGTDLIRPRLYIGTMADAAHWPCIKSLSITHVLNCAVQAQRGPPPYESKGIKYCCVPLHDTPDQAQLLQKNRFSIIRNATRFIRNVLREDPRACVLVHCVQGMSRSAVIVCAYLMEYEGMSVDKAIGEVRSKHKGCLTAQHWQAFLSKFNAALLKDP